jgi:hypothetical protein
MNAIPSSISMPLHDILDGYGAPGSLTKPKRYASPHCDNIKAAFRGVL